ncbi:CatB-related O-acetyltransferase [Celeribacter neptunius]|uniref:Transferase hexapeptide (Six repeat-containing protein) n=1 Tax=Celeribacter neptunius TaxID=588602 RepID=A0A1I3JDR0_9RHOB|nr:CatB-related O-acetyltransferase [Celeribacter neptunius]SFI58339.1 transferase hexapeptide (six repeat-containing protein) [Celeribacter neptunius]
MRHLSQAEFSHLYDTYRIRFYPRVQKGQALSGEDVAFEPMCQHPQEGFLPLGAFSYSQSFIEGLSHVGRYCSIGRGVHRLGVDHPADWVSTSPMFYKRRHYQRYARDDSPMPRSFDNTPAPINIGNDVWIADNAALKGGITIHDGAIIGYGAVVTKDVAPYTIVGGIPAKKIRDRFDMDIADALQASEWWRYDARDLSDLSMENPRAFLKEFEMRKPGLQPLPEHRHPLQHYLENSS